MPTTENPYQAIAEHAAWRESPSVSDLFQGRDSAILPVVDHRLQGPGILGDVRAWFEERRIRRTAMEVLHTLFRRNRPLLKARDLRVMVAVDDLGTSILLLPPSGRMMQLFSQDMDDYVCHCAGYMSASGWMWTDPTRLERLAELSTGNDRFVAAATGA